MNDLSAWPALVLTAGLATRLRPISDVRAKAAMPVAGQPIIGRILAWLRAAGVRRVVLNLHHRPETITRLVGDGAEWDMAVRYSWESTVLGSAGGPRWALPLVEANRFLLINGDTLTDCDLQRLVQRHEESRARVTMAVVPGDVGRYGGALVRADGSIAGFTRATSDRASAKSGDAALPALHFIGVQAVDADVFDDVPDDQPSETVRTLYPRLIDEDETAIAAFSSDAEFLDIGTAADYHRTVAMVAAREGARFDVGADCRIDAGADVRGTIVWDRVTIPHDAQLINCIVTDDVAVPAGTRYERCALVAAAEGVIVAPF
jgi:mannose-1-phosphate guanylyltransferase